MNRFLFVPARTFSALPALSLVLMSAVLCSTPARATTLDFEDLPLSQIYDLDAGTPGNPDSFVTNGVPVQLAEFFFLPSGSTIGGQAMVFDSIVDNFVTAGGAGNYLFMGNVNLDFDLGAPASQLSFLFGEFGGNLNIRVNGVLENVGSLFSLPATIGGAAVTVENLSPSPSPVLGRVTLTGNITSFAVGGQEFSIDDVIFIPVPEPSTWVLAIMALASVLIVRRRRATG